MLSVAMDEVRVAILQSNYIPWAGYFSIISKVNTFAFYDCVQYTNNDWRNRNKIKSGDCIKWLTIPVPKQGRTSRAIKDTYPSNNLWSHKHLQTIYHSYRRAKEFERIYPMIENLYSSLEDKSISKINQEIIGCICNYLKIKVTFRNSSDLVFGGDKTQRLVEICKALGANQYLSGPSAKDYLDIKLFKKNSIEVEWADYDHQMKPYNQLGKKFEGGLSILDLLFNLGSEEIKNYLV